MSDEKPSKHDVHALKARLAHATNLPTLPGVAIQILELAREPDIGVMDVAEVLSCDPALSTQVLRMANSPLYSRHRRIDNVRQALVLFGLDGALTVALSFSVARLIASAEREGGLDYAHFWRRSLTAAAAASVIAHRVRLPRAEVSFLSALIQDIGMLALDLLLPTLYLEVGADQYVQQRLTARERELTGATHGEVSVWLLEHWRFPPQIVELIGEGHRLVAQGGEPASREVAVLRVASALADAWWQTDRQSAIDVFAGQAERHLGLTGSDALDLIGLLEEEVVSLSRLLEVDLGDRAYLSAIADEARELLMLRNMRNLRHAREMELRTRELEKQAGTDPLTGAGNRRLFDEVLAAEFSAATKNQWPLSLMLVDLDHFKRINDTHGHQVGDAVLCEVVQRMRRCLRDADILARYGGEEFGIILPGTPSTGARMVAQRIMATLRACPVPVGGDSGVPVTVSIGVSSLNDGGGFDSPEAMLAAADRALYVVKESGRDGVQCESAE